MLCSFSRFLVGAETGQILHAVRMGKLDSNAQNYKRVASVTEVNCTCFCPYNSAYFIAGDQTTLDIGPLLVVSHIRIAFEVSVENKQTDPSLYPAIK